MNVYFFVDELNRDSITAGKLKARLEERGHKIFYGSRTSIKFLKFFHSYFDVMIIPRVSFLIKNFGNLWLSWNIKIVALSTESVGIISEDPSLWAKTALGKEYFEDKKKYANRIDLYALWGEQQYKAIIKYASEFKKKQLVICHTRYDRFVVKKYKKNNKKKIIGIITRAPHLNDYYGRNIIDFYKNNLNFNKYEFFNKRKKKGLLYKRNLLHNSIIQQTIDIKNILEIIKILNKNNYEIIVRQHPKEKNKQWSKILQKISTKIKIHNQNLPIHDFLGKIDYLLGPPSTSFYEAYLFKVKTLSICSLDKERKFFVPELGEDKNKLMKYILKPKSINQILNFLKNKTEFKTIKSIDNILKYEFDYPDCKNSLLKLVNKIEIITSKPKKRNFFLLVYKLFCKIYFLFWNFRNYLIKRKSHSAYFPLDYKTVKFIDNFKN